MGRHHERQGDAWAPSDDTATVTDLMSEYHRRSDHGRDGAPMDSFTCNCRELFTAHDRALKADAWDERSKARPSYLGPDDGHYDGCMGWNDCWCASWPNPYRDES